jgi:hypothetical protein
MSKLFIVDLTISGQVHRLYFFEKLAADNFVTALKSTGSLTMISGEWNPVEL